jgi:hypothetical protein
MRAQHAVFGIPNPIGGEAVSLMATKVIGDQMSRRNDIYTKYRYYVFTTVLTRRRVCGDFRHSSAVLDCRLLQQLCGVLQQIEGLGRGLACRQVVAKLSPTEHFVVAKLSPTRPFVVAKLSPTEHFVVAKLSPTEQGRPVAGGAARGNT